MSLSLYKEKRNFSDTPEPGGAVKRSGKTLCFVVQKHDASALHYDFRLELDGVLKSWAIPKGPSLNPADKRLAMAVEDHPYDYRNFEGVIPEGNYGAGTVIVWDEGTYELYEFEGQTKKEQEQAIAAGLSKGSIKIRLKGKKLKGAFTLMRMRKGGADAWLLIKVKDEFASDADITGQDASVKSGKTLAEIAAENGTSLNHPVTAAVKKKAAVKAKSKAATKKSNSENADARKTPVVQPSEGDEQDVVVNGQHVHFTSLSKPYWKKEGFTKGDMLRYYSEVMPFIFPYLKDRPQSLRRHPSGVGGASFFQKDVAGKVPAWIPTHEDFSESTGKPVHYLVCHHEATLLYMANLGCIELHPWHSRVGQIENPDYCLLDLDPHTGSTFEQVIETALVVKKVLHAAGVASYCKTSGSSGLHVYIPLGAKYTYDVAKSFAEIVVTKVQQELPEITSLERNPAKRKGKIYLDWLQNTLTQTAACAYSLRPKPGMPVSTPLHWDEVKKGLTPTTWNARNILERLRSEGDLFAPVLGKGVDIEKAMERLK